MKLNRLVNSRWFAWFGVGLIAWHSTAQLIYCSGALIENYKLDPVFLIFLVMMQGVVFWWLEVLTEAFQTIFDTKNKLATGTSAH